MLGGVPEVCPAIAPAGAEWGVRSRGHLPGLGNHKQAGKKPTYVLDKKSYFFGGQKQYII